MNKKVLLIATLGCLGLFSCKKEHKSSTDNQTTPAGTKYPVTFSVSGFSQNITTINSVNANKGGKVLAASSDSLRQTINKLEYILFNNTDHEEHDIVQTLSNANFGSLTDTLTAGSYTAYFVGSTSPYLQLLHDNKDKFNPASDLNLISSYYLTFNPLYPDDWSNTFIKKYTFQVGTANQQQNLTLDRVGGQLQLNILDAVPASVVRINIYYSYNNAYELSGNQQSSQLYRQVAKVDTVNAAQRTSGYQYMDGNILGGDTFDIEMDAYDNNNQVLYKTIVSTVSVVSNKKTVVSGYLFTPNNPKNGGFSISTQPLGGTASTVTFSRR